MKKTIQGKAAAANDTDAAASDQKTVSLRNEALFLSMEAYQRRHSLSDEKLGRRLNSNGTYVSRYRSRTFIGDMAEFETSIEDMLMREKLMEGDACKVAESGFCVQAVTDFLDLVKNQRMMSVGHGPSGRGKTQASALYAAKHKGTIYLHINAWSNGRDRVIEDIATLAGVRRAKSDRTLTDAIARVLKDSERLLILDNAHRLTESGRKWLADFSDATRIGIALIGNPEIVKQFAKNDQHGSRLGRCVDVTTITDTKTTVIHLLESYLPEAAADKASQNEALTILRQDNGGSARAVKMHLRLAAKIRQGCPTIATAEAIRQAKTQLDHAA